MGTGNQDFKISSGTVWVWPRARYLNGNRNKSQVPWNPVGFFPRTAPKITGKVGLESWKWHNTNTIAAAHDKKKSDTKIVNMVVIPLDLDEISTTTQKHESTNIWILKFVLQLKIHGSFLAKKTYIPDPFWSKNRSTLTPRKNHPSGTLRLASLTSHHTCFGRGSG